MKQKKLEFGIKEIEFDTWDEFTSFVNKNLKYRHFIWRGQTDSSWLLEPTLERILKKTGKASYTKIINEHLKRFQYAIRGRRGLNPSHLETENEWWALGQHNGLATPLLDWSKSPFVAAFFAFNSSGKSSTNKHAIYGISKTSFEWKSNTIKKDHKGSTRPAIIEFIEPLSDENARLVNQGGLFSRSPAGVDIELWMKTNFQKDDDKIRMWKLLFSESIRNVILQSLNRMNINYASLFPDIYGASKFVNMDLEIKNY
jgi:hypothetical protein